MSNKIFDAHCHIFNIRYLVKEVIKMLWDFIDHTYPLDTSTNNSKGVRKKNIKSKNQSNTIDDIKEYFKWLFQIGESLVDNEKKNMKLLQEKAHNAWPLLLPDKNSLAIIPLMMDIFYMFDSTLGKGEKITSPLSVNSGKKPDIKLFHNQLRSIIRNIPGKRKRKALFYKHINGHEKRVTKTETAEKDGIYWTWGFEDHYNKLKNLVKQYPGHIYPFFAIDPRRPGVIEALINGEIVDPVHGPFYGVKLYPRLGCHPECAPLIDVYDYCAEKNIPITTHTSKGGFPGFPAWEKKHPECADFGNPKNFEHILKDHSSPHNKLRINFAHFGHNEDHTDIWDDWGSTIVGFMNTYNTDDDIMVYADLSCYTKGNALNLLAKRDFWNKNPKIVKKYTLYGTDYDVMYFTDMHDIDLVKYFKDFNKFSQDELKKMSGTLVEKFLNMT